MKKRLKQIYGLLSIILVCIFTGNLIVYADTAEQYFDSKYFFGYSLGNGGENYGKDNSHSPINIVDKVIINGKKYYVEEIAYCLNEEQKTPSMAQTPFKPDGSYKNNFDAFLNSRAAREQLYLRLNSKVSNTDQEIKNSTKNRSDTGSDIRKVLWNGYPVDSSNLKYTYNLTDMQFRAVTQAAIWYFATDHGLLTNKESILNNFIKKFENEHFTWNNDCSKVYKILTGMENYNNLKTPSEEFMVSIYQTTYPNIYQRLISVGIKGGLKINLTKKWVGKEANSISVKLYANNELIQSKILNKENKVGDVWRSEFKDLPQFDINWNRINYKVIEDDLENYETNINGDSNNGFIITNTIKNISKEVLFSKHDLAGNELAGATIELSDKADGKVIDTWVSDGKGPHTFSLKPGNYVFTEKAAPEGYEVTTAINFTVNPDGTVTSDDVKVTGDNSNHIVMVDGYAPKEVLFSKHDLAGNELAGATIELSNKADGKVIDTWVSDG
ncbi:SpaA isopeptide-forming pilin-related protein, partial [Clostridium perfringens]